MKIKASQADRFVAAPPSGIRAALIYGPDAGLIRERSNCLAKFIIDDLSDPFRIAELTDAALKQDPARLADEAAALSMIGGRRLVRVRGASDGLTKIFRPLLDAPDPIGDTLIIAEAGELGPRSTLRRAFEDAGANAAALPCYADDAGTLEHVINDTLARAGHTADPAATAFLVEHLGADRGVTLRELEKLCLYMAPKTNKATGIKSAGGTRAPITLDDVRTCIGEAGGARLDALIDTTASGDLAGLNANLARAREADLNAIAILSALSRHLQRLHQILGQIEDGGNLDTILRALRPPVHFSRQAALKRQCRLWSRRRLDRALGLIMEADAACKTTGMPDMALSGQTLIRVAQAAHHAANHRSRLAKSDQPHQAVARGP